jgi:1-acyl-sn-glycerol-3-phosphate acyltransferase
MKNRIISLGILFFIGTTSVLFFIIALVIWAFTVLFDRRLVVLHLFTSFWASLYLWVVPAWSISIKGREKIKRNTTYLVVSNHQSQLDILAVFNLFFHFKWVSKAEIFKLPMIGWNMALNRYIKLKRGVGESVRKMMLQCEKTLAQGSSIYFFPEGTRSRTGLLKPFKTGAFILAHKSKIPILPIVINGTKNALPKHSLNFHGRHAIIVEVLDEVPYNDYAHFSVAETADFIRDKIIEHVDEHKAPHDARKCPIGLTP